MSLKGVVLEGFKCWIFLISVKELLKPKPKTFCGSAIFKIASNPTVLWLCTQNPTLCNPVVQKAGCVSLGRSCKQT